MTVWDVKWIFKVGNSNRWYVSDWSHYSEPGKLPDHYVYQTSSHHLYQALSDMEVGDIVTFSFRDDPNKTVRIKSKGPGEGQVTFSRRILQ